MNIKLTPDLFLAAQGIDLQSTVLNTFIDGYVRQPDLCALMEEYAKMKIAELDYQVSPNSSKLINNFYNNEKTSFTF